MFDRLSPEALDLLEEISSLEHESFAEFMAWLRDQIRAERIRRSGLEPPPTLKASREVVLDAAEASWATGGALLGLKTDVVSQELKRECVHFLATLSSHLEYGD